MSTRKTLSLPPSLHRQVKLEQARVFAETGEEVSIGSLLEGAWAKASTGGVAPESPPIAGSSTDDLKRQIAELTQAKNLIANTLDALQRIVNAQSHLDATVDELERAIATGENPGSGGESDSEDGVKAAP